MRKTERRLIQLLAGIVAGANFAAFDSWAQSYPAKPIRMVVGFAAGGATDATGRMVAQKCGVLAPAGVPKDIIAQLNATIAKAINTPDMKESLNKLGFEPHTSTPEQFAALIRTEIAQNAKLIKAVGVKAE